MPAFFRSHSSENHIDLTQEPKKVPRHASPARLSTHRNPSSTGAVKPNEKSAMVDSKRISLGGLGTPKGSNKSVPQHVPARLDVIIESPPLVMYGTTAQSTGALLSGQLRLTIAEDKIAIEKFQMRLVIDVTRKKPFHAHCNDCANQSTDLTSWNFLQGPATLRKGMYCRPISCIS